MSALFKYISEDSPQNAGKVVEDIIAATEESIANPGIYPPDKNKKDNDGRYRAFEIHRYRIGYRVTKNIIRVLRVRHTKREPKIYLSFLASISIQKNWGYIDVDKFNIYTVHPNVFDITSSLIDGQATVEAKGLYGYLLSQFGKNIISGSTGDYYDNVKQIVGKSPLLKAWDFASYSPMYAYNWADGHHVFGAVDNHDAENAISWYNFLK